MNSYRHTYTNDINGNRLAGLVERWYNNAWVNFVRETYAYDISGNIPTYLHEYWNTNTWTNYGKDTYNYDDFGNAITGKYEKWENNNWLPEMCYLGLYYKKSLIKFIVNIYRYIASYKFMTTDIVNIKENISFVVFPNPAADNITIKSSLNDNLEKTISIYNIKGQLLIQQQNQIKNSIDLNKLAKGIYTIKISNKDYVNFTKLVKE